MRRRAATQVVMGNRPVLSRRVLRSAIATFTVMAMSPAAAAGSSGWLGPRLMTAASMIGIEACL